MESISTLLAVLTPIALFDSTSITPLCIVPLITLLSGPQPLLRAGAFLTGIFISYLICSMLVLFGMQEILSDLSEFMGERLRNPDTLDLCLQIVLGVCMIFFGSKMADARESRDNRGLTESVTTIRAFSAGAMLTIIGLPGAIPLFAAVDQILRADPGLGQKILAITYYNFLFILPVSSVLVLRLWMGERAESLLARVNGFIARWGHRVVVWGLVIGGALFVLDGIGWFMGHPVLPTFD